MSETQSTTKRKKQQVQETEMSFLEHLEVLRWHLIRAFGAVFLLAILAFINKNFIFDQLIMAPKHPDFWTNRMFALLSDWLQTDVLRINTHELNLISISMAGQFSTHIWTSIIAGLILASPYVIWEFWRFIKPALYESERKHSTGAVFTMTGLFIAGVLFGYYLIVPLSIDFLGAYSISSEVTNQINVLSYIGTVTTVTLATGVVFELPVFVYFLSRVGILTPAFMRKYRRHAYVILLIVSAIITPPDVFSQILVCVPLVILFEVGIVISQRVQKKADAAIDEI
ncbi:MAG: twin-arginine translocase subunit TatC [Mangrovibacterium sp.]